MSEVVAVNVVMRVALFDDGVARAFSNMLDELGDETDDPSEAVSAVVEETPSRWHFIDLRDFETPVRH